ncbi:MAG: 3-phosphoshikimate 1-carboxyvinyltransferase [Desulfosarcinaceae bacterium]
MIDIQCGGLKAKASVQVPGSKSYTHRTLIAAALSDGACMVRNPLRSEDTQLTLEALGRMGVAYKDQGEALELAGCSGRLGPCREPIHLGTSGTSMRLLAGIVVLGQGTYTLTGSERMHQRPIQPLLDSLKELGVEARSLAGNGCPPVAVEGGQCPGGRTRIDCSVSSQYLSALMLAGPCLAHGLRINVTGGPVSKPYIDLTVDILHTFGIRLERDGYTRFKIPGGQVYQAGDYTVEADGSQAGYFWGAAAISGNLVKAEGVTSASRQGDVALARVLERMGCRVDDAPDGIAVAGAPALTGVDVDMADMPDMVPTLAVVAAFARGTTTIRNVAHLRAKESDRLAAVCRELGKMGIRTASDEDTLTIHGGRPQGADIETYNDHRIAMSFAMAGVKVPGVRILDEACVEKSFPGFWKVFESLYE